MLENQTLFVLTLLVLGLLCGGLIGWLIGKLFAGRDLIGKKQLKENYVAKPLYEELSRRIEALQNEIHSGEERNRELIGRVAALDQQNRNLEDKLEQQSWETAEWHRRSIAEFENLANRIFEEKGQKITSQNITQLSGLLSPLKERIQHFEQQVEKRYFDDTKERISLIKEIEQLRDLNSRLSQDANNLTNALKGQSKLQGDWGEMQLELLLQKAGLVKDVHFRAQSTFKDDEGRLKRPDFIINLPGDKHLVIDSKVSLRDYEKFYNTDNHSDRRNSLKAHLQAIRQHIKNLSGKNYQMLHQINSPDYLLLYIPIEPAFALATQEDPKIFLDALDQNIVIVTNSTLLATLRTVSYIWKQEKQKKSVLEIARQSGLLYDKFCAFVEDLESVGNRLTQANNAYRRAMNKLTEAERKGDTLIGKAEKIRALGAKTSKQIPDRFLGELE